MSEPVSTSDAIRLQQPEGQKRGLSSFAEYRLTAREKPTPVVINLQRRLIHRVSPRGTTSCNVNHFDVQISPFSRCSVQLIPRSPIRPRFECGHFFGSEA